MRPIPSTCVSFFCYNEKGKAKTGGTTNATLFSTVQKLQNFAAKVAVGGARKYDHVSPS